MDLSTEVITHYIITVQGSHYPITAEREKVLQTALNTDMFRTQEGVLIKVSNIVEVIPSTKYAELYPEKQSQTYGQPYSPITPDTRPYTGKSWINGLEDYYNRHPEKKTGKGYQFYLNHLLWQEHSKKRTLDT